MKKSANGQHLSGQTAQRTTAAARTNHEDERWQEGQQRGQAADFHLARPLPAAANRRRVVLKTLKQVVCKHRSHSVSEHLCSAIPQAPPDSKRVCARQCRKMASNNNGNSDADMHAARWQRDKTQQAGEHTICQFRATTENSWTYSSWP
jgi:hypothetical protein